LFSFSTFRAGAPIQHNRFDRGFKDLKVCDEGVFGELFARVFASNGQFPVAIIDFNRFLITTQRQLVGIALGVDFAIFSIPRPLLIVPQHAAGAPGNQPFRTKQLAPRGLHTKFSEGPFLSIS
jgi:hypothetical protein